MKSIEFQKCPICFQSITSDATIKNYCKFCGMGIENKNKKYCCESCKNESNKINKRWRNKRGTNN